MNEFQIDYHFEEQRIRIFVPDDNKKYGGLLPDNIESISILYNGKFVLSMRVERTGAYGFNQCISLCERKEITFDGLLMLIAGHLVPSSCSELIPKELHQRCINLAPWTEKWLKKSESFIKP